MIIFKTFLSCSYIFLTFIRRNIKQFLYGRAYKVEFIFLTPSLRVNTKKVSSFIIVRALKEAIGGGGLELLRKNHTFVQSVSKNLTQIRFIDALDLGKV